MVTLPEAEQPFASVAVTLYVPGTKLLMVAEVAPLLQRYAYGAVPPLPAAQFLRTCTAAEQHRPFENLRLSSER